ncbi:hypothetical protein [Corynebacterium sp.]|uniref:hypothetical protein n=1 Tax=Corynebacterium sp. TaxID=1720 RepID=UPI0025C308A8|nr:hypothetical protein [Corynebacterium sp.]
MTRTRRTTALLAAAVLALGATACQPPSENDSERTAPSTEVTPDSGFEGAGVPTTSAPASESGEPTEAGTVAGTEGAPDTVGDTEPYAPGAQTAPVS